MTAIDLGKARSTAKDSLAQVRLGNDPFADKLEKRQKIDQTFGALLPTFMTYQRGRLKLRSMLEIQQFLEIYAKPWHGLPASGIDRATVATMLAKLGVNNGPGAANRFRAAVSSYFSWLCREGVIEANPKAFTNKHVEGDSRSRLLSDAELASIWRAASPDNSGRSFGC